MQLYTESQIFSWVLNHTAWLEDFFPVKVYATTMTSLSWLLWIGLIYFWYRQGTFKTVLTLMVIFALNWVTYGTSFEQLIATAGGAK